MAEHGGRTQTRLYVAMRDAVRLDTNIFFPREVRSDYPVVLIRSPYPVEASLDAAVSTGDLPLFLERGYVIVFQSERGRNWSEGDYGFLGGAGDDGYDTIDWIARQPWSNGKVVTYGCSSPAENQLALSVKNHPAHAAAIAQAPGSGIGRIGAFHEQGNFYRGGAIQLLFARWYNESIFYGGAGSRQRPVFPADLSQADRTRLSRLFSLQRVPSKVDYAAFFHHLPIQEMVHAVDGPLTQWDEFSTRTPGDPAWRSTPFANEGDVFGVPMLWMFSWYDLGIAPNIALYQYATRQSAERAKGNQFVVVGPGTHCQFGRETAETIVGERNLGDARFDYNRLYLAWLDYWTKGERNEIERMPRVQYYVMGKNRWVSSDRWPIVLPRKQRYFLRSNGNANSVHGDGQLTREPPKRLAADQFVYDPLHPVPTRGGGACCMPGAAQAGAYDQGDIEKRADVLVYTTPVLEQGVEVTGFIDVLLHVSSDAKDTDFTAKLVDVYPDGRAYNLDDTIQRMRYRQGYDQPVWMKEAIVYPVRLGPMVTSNYFAAGHRIRLEISSSNFPRFERNLNTGGNNFDETRPVSARNRVHHAPRYPSYVDLPIIER